MKPIQNLRNFVRAARNLPRIATATGTLKGKLDLISVLEDARPDIYSLFSPDPQTIIDTNAYYRMIELAPMKGQEAIDYIRSKTFGSDYLEFHERRFGEQLSLFSYLCEHFAPLSRVLDISTMPYTTNIMKYYRPEIELVTIDMPEEMGGPDLARFAELGVERHFAIDLDNADLNKFAEEVRQNGRYDLIFACEVIEHLKIDFADFASFCLSCLRPGGLVVITTPNFLSGWKLERILQGFSPQQRFKDHKDSAGSYHFREYTMKELNQITKEVGAEVVSQVYTSSLLQDHVHRAEESQYHFRENMVFIFSNEAQSLLADVHR